LRNDAGKCLIFFVVSQLVVYLAVPLLDSKIKFVQDLRSDYRTSFNLLIICGVFTSILWFSVMIFDVWWCLR